MIKIFISHRSRDVALANALIHLLRFALRLSAEDIRCTSVPGYNLPGGAQTEQQLRQELLDAPVYRAEQRRSWSLRRGHVMDL